MSRPTFDELLDAIRVAKAEHAVAYRGLTEAQTKADAAWSKLAAAQRAVGEYVDQLTDQPPAFKPRVVR